MHVRMFDMIMLDICMMYGMYAWYDNVMNWNDAMIDKCNAHIILIVGVKIDYQMRTEDKS